MNLKLGWIICPNGGGHKYRSEKILFNLKDYFKENNFETSIWGPKISNTIDFNFNEIPSSNNYCWPNYKIENFNANDFDLIIVDNIIERNLGYFLKENNKKPFIFLSSFLWEYIDNLYEKNKIEWIFNRSNSLFIFNKYFHNPDLIGFPKFYRKHGITFCGNQKSFSEISKSKNIYITLGLSKVFEKNIISKINQLVKKIKINHNIFIDENLKDYIRNIKVINHYEGLIKADLLICRPGLGTLNQAIGIGIKNFITCPEIKNIEMISNEKSLKKIANVKNIFENDILDFINKLSPTISHIESINIRGFEEISLIIKEYIKSNF